jgi:hypothetical protein
VRSNALSGLWRHTTLGGSPSAEADLDISWVSWPGFLIVLAERTHCICARDTPLSCFQFTAWRYHCTTRYCAYSILEFFRGLVLLRVAGTTACTMMFSVGFSVPIAYLQVGKGV